MRQLSMCPCSCQSSRAHTVECVQLRMNRTMYDVQQVLLVLTAAVACGPNIPAAVAHFRQLASAGINVIDSGRVLDHLHCLRAAVELIADVTTTAEAMQAQMITLRCSMLMHGRSMCAVQQGCVVLQQNLVCGFDPVRVSMCALHLIAHAFSEQMLAGQQGVQDVNLEKIKGYLVHLFASPAAVAEWMKSGRVLTVRCRLR